MPKCEISTEYCQLSFLTKCRISRNSYHLFFYKTEKRFSKFAKLHIFINFTFDKVKRRMHANCRLGNDRGGRAHRDYRSRVRDIHRRRRTPLSTIFRRIKSLLSRNNFFLSSILFHFSIINQLGEHISLKLIPNKPISEMSFMSCFVTFFSLFFYYCSLAPLLRSSAWKSLCHVSQ